MLLRLAMDAPWEHAACLEGFQQCASSCGPSCVNEKPLLET